MRFSHNGLDNLMDGDMFSGISNRQWLDKKLSRREIHYVHRIESDSSESDIKYLVDILRKRTTSTLLVLYEDSEGA